MAVAAQEQGLLPLKQMSMQFFGRTSYHDYEGIAPKGCLANPTFPAPTIARFCPGNQLADTVMKALSAAMPGNVSAGVGNLVRA